MIARRAAMLGLLLPLPAGLSAAPIGGLPPGNRLAFRVSRNGSPVGTHVLDFALVQDGLDISVTVDIAVGLGPITLYRYRLRGVERWRDARVARADFEANDDGTAAFMRARRGPEGLWIEGSGVARYLAPADALPATHWNAAQLDGPWINPQDGKLLRPEVARRGAELLQLRDGRRIPADHFALSGEVRMELWYDEARRWSALRAPGKDGSAIAYDLS